MAKAKRRLEDVLGERIERVLGLQGLSESGDAVVYLSGSLIEGHGHATSDIDVFVVGDQRPQSGLQLEIENYEVAIDFGDYRRIDYEFWRRSEVEALAAKLENLRQERDFLAVFREWEEVFLHRLRVGMPLSSRESFEQLQSLFDFSKLQRYLTIKAIREMDNALDDLTGMLDSGELHDALLRSTEVIGYAADAWHHHQGSTNPYQKWRLKILRDLPDSGPTRRVVDAFWRYRFPDASVLRDDPVACRAHIEGCMEFANEVVGWIQP